MIVLDSAGAVLLQHIEGDAGRSWIVPGGGLNAGETNEQAARRELAEEVGLADVELGPQVWRRTSEFTFRGVRYRQEERFYVARVDTFEPDDSGLDAEEIGMVLGHKWWTLGEIASSTNTVFWPRRLGELLRPLVAGHIPSTVIDADD